MNLTNDLRGFLSGTSSMRLYKSLCFDELFRGKGTSTYKTNIIHYACSLFCLNWTLRHKRNKGKAETVCTNLHFPFFILFYHNDVHKSHIFQLTSNLFFEKEFRRLFFFNKWTKKVKDKFKKYIKNVPFTVHMRSRLNTTQNK